MNSSECFSTIYSDTELNKKLIHQCLKIMMIRKINLSTLSLLRDFLKIEYFIIYQKNGRYYRKFK